MISATLEAQACQRVAYQALLEGEISQQELLLILWVLTTQVASGKPVIGAGTRYIAKALRIGKSSVSRLIASLEAKGWLRASRPPSSSPKSTFGIQVRVPQDKSVQFLDILAKYPGWIGAIEHHTAIVPTLADGPVVDLRMVGQGRRYVDNDSNKTIEVTSSTTVQSLHSVPSQVHPGPGVPEMGQFERYTVPGVGQYLFQSLPTVPLQVHPGSTDPMLIKVPISTRESIDPTADDAERLRRQLLLKTLSNL